jgi:hypothetical protein
MKKIGLLLLAALLPVSPLAFSQSTPATTPASAPNAALPSAQVITLGNSVVSLEQGWKFEPGDSPWVSGAPEWAEPDFDDSKWAAMDLTPKAGSVDLYSGVAGYLSGWTRRGYPELSGYAWYRLRVKTAGAPLWLKMPADVDDAYQVYANGHYVGQFGGFSLNHVTMYISQPLSFPLPPPGPDGEMDLAVRFYMTAGTRFTSPDVGGMHQPPALGQASTVHLLQAADHDADMFRYVGTLLGLLLFLLVAPLALWAWLKNRKERTYLWLFFALACSIFTCYLTMLGGLSFGLTLPISVLTRHAILSSLSLPLWVMFWWHWFGLQRKRWITLAAWLLTAAEILTASCADSPYFVLSLVPFPWLHWFNAVSVCCRAAVGVLLIVVLVEGFRRDLTEALLAAPPILLVEFASFGIYLLTTFDIPLTVFPFGIGIAIADLASILMVLVIGVLTLRRFLRTQVLDQLVRQSMKKDMEQAQQLQQRVLVPEALHSQFFTVETEYRPAQTVGGDFFQTLTKPDGSLLVVIGDVSGKGVSAAMLVAVLVGAIRNRAEDSFDPASMLARLNRRMLGRSGGHFATCMVAEILPDGTMGIANAGHLSPYLNGEEMELEGSLPLGIVGDTEYSVQNFMLKPGDRLTFMTDGVVEATNAAKQLFGFDRTREISRQRAAAIVEQAQSFGQEDDITVLGVDFAGLAVQA